MKILLPLMLLSFMQLSHAQFDKKIAPVTADSRVIEYKNLMKNFDGVVTKEDFCKSAFDNLNYTKYYMRHVDSNLPKVNVAKKEKLDQLIKERKSLKSSDEHKSKIFREMFNDPEYHIYQLHLQIKNTLVRLDHLNWKYSKENLDAYLRNLRGKEYYSVFEQQFMRDLINNQIELKDEVNQVFYEIEDARKNLDVLGHVDKLEKSLGKIFPDSYSRVAEMKYTAQGRMNRIIACELDYLSRF
jgi:hypothetical protein